MRARRVVIVPGDHDAALLFPSLGARVSAALQAPGRVEIATRGYWRSADGVVYVEHGHEQTGDPYALPGWPRPFVERAGRSYLARTSGEQLAQSVGLTEHQWGVLEEISTEHFMPSMFARQRDSTPAAVSKTLRQLIDKGLIEVKLNKSDGRQRD